MEMTVYPSSNLRCSRYEYALASLRGPARGANAKVVCDIGAGDGRLKAEVEVAGGTWRGFDLSPSAPEIAEWDLGLPCPDRDLSAQYVLLLDVIEHLKNPGLALSGIASVLESGGRLVMTTPNPRWSRSRIHALLYGVPACFTQSDLDLNGHLFTPWPHIMMKMLRDAGFEIEEYVTLDGKTRMPTSPITLRYPLRVLHALINMLIERLDPSACGMSYGLIARKR